VTSYDQAQSLNTPRKVVFLCAVTAGQSLLTGVFAFVQELGLATVQLKNPITNASPNVGDVINITSTGADDPTSQTETAAAVGIATQAPASGSLTVVALTAPAFQE
jgi:hypothetical protein